METPQASPQGPAGRGSVLSSPPGSSPTLCATIAQYDKAIAYLLDRLGHYRRERKRLVSRETMKRQMSDPAFKAHWQASVQAAYVDPVRNAEWRESRRLAALASHRALPPMTREQRKVYLKLQKHGMSREDAIKEALR